MAAADDISHLDFAPGPMQCDSKASPQCQGVATFCIRVHWFGGCNHPSVGPDRKVTQFVCGPCKGAREATIGELMQQSARAQYVLGAFITCGGCGEPLDDIGRFYEARSINE